MAAATARDQSVQLRVIVDKERKKVLYAEAGKDFVDVLFSFLTLPLGTIVRLVAKESNIGAVIFGSLSSLYQSVANLDAQYLCKEMLVKPRNSMEDYCRPMKLNIDDTEPMRYFRCPNWECNRRDYGICLSTFKNLKCTCGKVMDKEVFPNWSNLENGFLNETTLIVCDDLSVMPNVFETIVSLLQKHGVDNRDTIQEQTVDITKKEVIDLLKLSLLSKTPLTDFIFNKKQFDGNSNLIAESVFDIGKVVSSKLDMEMRITVKRKKSNAEIMFAEVQEDFANLLFSFLTFPLGGVLHMLEGFTLGCLSNLHMSMKELSLDRYLISWYLKDNLVKPKIAPQFGLTNQILPIGAAESLPSYSCHTYHNGHLGCVDLIISHYESQVTKANVVEKCVRFDLVDPMISSSKSSSSWGFAKGPSTYMVTGNLAVTPLLYTHVMSYLNSSKVSIYDLEEKVIKIGREEALCILKASLVTANSLTHCLNQFITMVKDPVAV